jgi:cysteine-rich repeat protein
MCRREAPTSLTWVATTPASFADCAAWDLGAPPRDGDSVIVAATATAALELPSLSLAALTLQAGTTAVVTLAAAGHGSLIARVDAAGGVVQAPALGTAVVGDVQVAAGAALRLAPGDLALGLDEASNAALAVRGSLTLDAGAVFDGDEGVLLLLPLAPRFGVATVRAAAPLVVADLLLAPLGVEDERPREPASLAIAAAVDVRRLTLIASHDADADAEIVGTDGGSLRTATLRTAPASAASSTSIAHVDASLPVTVGEELVLLDDAVAWHGPVHVDGLQSRARIAHDDVALIVDRGVVSLDAAGLRSLSVGAATVVATRSLRASSLTLATGGQFVGRVQTDVDTLDIGARARFVAPTTTVIRGLWTVASSGRYVAGTGLTTVGEPGATTRITGSIDVHDLVLRGQGVVFGPATTLRIAGTWTARGDSTAARLALRGGSVGIAAVDAGREQWTVDPAGAVDLDHLVVRDSRNIGDVVLEPADWVDEGNNTGWGVVDSCAGLVASEGSVTLASDADVAAFNASGVQCVRGDLLLTGSVTNAALPHVVRIVGALRIVGTTSLVAVELPALGQAGDVTVLDNRRLQTLELPDLTTTGSVDISGNDALAAVGLGALADVDGSVVIGGNDALQLLDLANLAHVGGDLTVADNDALTALDLSGLVSVAGDLSIRDHDALAAVALGAASVGGDLTLTDNDALVSFVAAFLRSIGGALAVADNALLREIALTALQTVGEGVGIVAAEGVDTLVVRMPSLATADAVTIDNEAGVVVVDLGELQDAEVDIEGTVVAGSELPVDGCSDGCAVCGDGRREADEACDDGDRDDGDGCSATCVVEDAFACAPVDGGVDRCGPDGDGDGVTDDRDNCARQANPQQQDADADRRGDACDADDDGDGVPDLTDRCPLAADATQGDADADGVGDACDVPPLPPVCDGAAADDDGDGDGLGDACDDDDDGDGIDDRIDRCVGAADAAQIDTDRDGDGDVCDDDDDGDGLVDAVDACPLLAGAEGCAGDADGDGVGDDDDVCADVADPDQADTDDDGLGDACDRDDDGDGVADGDDACPLVDDDQADTDGDGTGDACDVCPGAPDQAPECVPVLDDGDGAPPEESCASGGPAPSFVAAWLTLGALGLRRRRAVGGGRRRVS